MMKNLIKVSKKRDSTQKVNDEKSDKSIKKEDQVDTKIKNQIYHK